MRYARGFSWLLPLALVACQPEIVLGDSEGASGPGSAVPVPGAVLWSTDHEAGSVDDWALGGDAQGGEFYWGDAQGEVRSGIGRDGSQALVMTIDTSFSDAPSQGFRVYRRIEPAPAFYSASFRLEEAHAVSDWWSIFLFHARNASLSLENDTSLWDVRVVNDAGGGMALQFFDHETQEGSLSGRLGAVMPGQWFELTAYLDYLPPDATRLRILLDGAPLFDMTGLRTALHEHVFWAVGNGANGLSPALSTLYMDDAAIRATEPTP